MVDKSVEEIIEELMELPKFLIEKMERHDNIIKDMIKHQEYVIELICKLHDIDLDELKRNRSEA